VRNGRSVWDAESGQVQFDFDVGELARKVRPHARQVVERAAEDADLLDAEQWHAMGIEVEAAAPEEAREAYRRALELDPFHVESRVNLGRLLHESGMVEAAQAQYRLALVIEPGNATVLFNLGVALEDLGRDEDALARYREAIARDPDYADAYYNLARLCEKRGDSRSALRYLNTYRKLTEGH
jgi:tetratricopeptide (TPR) repeat protein